MPRGIRFTALAWGSWVALTALLAAASGACGSDQKSSAPSTSRRAAGTSTSSVGAGSPETTTPTGGEPETSTSTGGPAEDLVMEAGDFRNILAMTKVRGFYIDNGSGHLGEALRVARSPDGGVYPVGTVIQLIPTEAMVKRRKGFNPDAGDWEFFFLEVSGAGTKIKSRGTSSVRNGFGLGCQSCHSGAEPQWDMVCEDDHGCVPLPFTDSQIEKIQTSDPRPR